MNVKPDSALARKISPDSYIWSSRAKTNALLADIFDLLGMINANLCAKGTKHRPKKPKPYPRPGDKNKKTETTHIGSGAMPPDKLREWFRQKELEGGETDG